MTMKYIKIIPYIVLGLMTLAIMPSKVSAQDGNNKPKLVEIIVNSSTTSADALEVAKKLDPIFFDIAKEDREKVDFYARFLSLDENNENNYLIVTAEDSSGFYCTGHGCPFYLYRGNNSNQWSLILSIQAFNLYHDLNTQGEKPDNIISIGNMQGQRHLSIWAWNGQNYSEIKR